MRSKYAVALAIVVVLLASATTLASGRRKLANRQTVVSANRSITGLYRFTSLDPPGSVGTFPIGINNDGLMTGQYIDADGVVHSFTWKHGKYKLIDVPGAPDTLASTPNSQGQVALTYVDSNFYLHQALYSNGQYTYLPDAPGWLNIAPAGINDRGHISGAVWNDPTFTIVHGYVWDGSNFAIYDEPNSDIPYTTPFGINNQEQIVGQYNTSDGVVHGYLKRGGTYTEIVVPGAPNTAALGINNWGVIVGTYGDAPPSPFGFGSSHGFVLWGGTYWTLDRPGALTSFSMDINDWGQIVGSYQDLAGTYHGYLATPK
ncbi:MAG TPA: hypothetical protein VMH04_24325 [Candidatus Solibacter sp.]|nr:hypothetical protein [Candidatus Solibacter sp.]